MDIKGVARCIEQAEHVTIILGAGASVTADIPSAQTLIKEINDEHGHRLNNLSDADKKDYGKAMGALAPAVRKQLLTHYLDKSRINWGHIALATIIRGQSNLRRVLTFNFDLILERSASLLGMHLPVYDFGVSPTKEISRLAEPAIIHLHGQSYGMRLMNSDAETKRHKEALRPLIADSVRNHLTIVVGYSGEADGAFEVIEEEFNSHQEMIWLGYSKTPKRHLEQLLGKDHAEYVGGCDFDNSMIEVAKALGHWMPDVIKNPPRHVLSELEEVVDFPVEVEKGYDALTDTRRRLEEAANVWESERSGEGNVQMSLVSGDDVEPVDADSPMTLGERNARSWTHLKKGHFLFRDARQSNNSSRADKLELAIQEFEAAIELSPANAGAYCDLGYALNFKAEFVDGKNRQDLLDASLSYFEKASELEPSDPSILYNWGAGLILRALDLKGSERQEKLDEAAAKLIEAKRLGISRHFNFACIEALRGNSDQALEILEMCAEDGTLPSKLHLAEDLALESLRGNPRFEALFT
jgi:tetratricopeptide (TPR) repeat protein